MAIGAAGASFGGYMMNWFQGHTTKFKTLITHCGVYNFDSMYALTDELWFDEWEHGGTPWEKRDSYEKHSPHKFAKNFKTPMLIIHNDRDYRVPVSEGIQLFTTLQRLGITSRFINSLVSSSAPGSSGASVTTFNFGWLRIERHSAEGSCGEAMKSKGWAPGYSGLMKGPSR